MRALHVQRDEVRWEFTPNADKYRRLLNLLFRESSQPRDMERGRVA